MKKIIEKMFGIDKIKAETEQNLKIADEAKKLAEEATAAAERAREAEELAKLTPKERATRKGEPWVAVLDVKVNKDNLRNGFFELDWNHLFIEDLIKAGYGLAADPEEEIVDRWFRTIVYQMLDEEGLDTSRGFGYINVVPIEKGRSSVS